MYDISNTDKNFKVETSISRGDLIFFNAFEEPFKIYGLLEDNDKLRRIPEAVAASVNDGVYALHANTAGGRVRFVTDSDYVAIHTKMSQICRMSHFALTGSAGFDMYGDDGENEIYCGTFIPPYDMADGYESIIDFDGRKKRIITINFPLYSSVEKLYVGVQKNSVLEAAPEYKITKPIVYYGSSITQGACASRPGNSYQSILARKFDCDYINLGFSGSAMGEDEISEYISKLDMSAFVYDYDYNAPTAEHLALTHEKMFRKIRENNPSLPILILSRPYPHLNEDALKRLEVIKNTYTNAKSGGDENVYFIDGRNLIQPAVLETATVDGVHPNDSGFVSMAGVIGEVFRKAGL